MPPTELDSCTIRQFVYAAAAQMCDTSIVLPDFGHTIELLYYYILLKELLSLRYLERYLERYLRNVI